jgi:hypothetical protein
MTQAMTHAITQTARFALTPATHRRPLCRHIAPGGLLAAALSLGLAGCSLGTVQMSGPAAQAVQSSGLSGVLHGGEQQIVGATVKLYQVGTTGYGTGATAIAGATATTLAGGYFNIPSYTCPTSTALVYLVATGGNPGLSATDNVTAETVTGSAGAYTVTFTGSNDFHVGQSVTLAGFSAFSYLNGAQTVTAVGASTGTANTSFSIADTSASDPGTGSYTDTGVANGTTATNANLKMVAPIGQCSAASGTSVFLNEVVTAAAAYALAQYINPSTGLIGAPNTTLAQTGISNAFNTFANLVTLSTGVANASSTKTANGYTITLTPEYMKLNTVADIIAACTNSPGGTEGDGSICGTLFANVGTTNYPTDTFAAAVDMALNPTSTTAQITKLYALIPPTPAFSAVNNQPTDWTIGILYSDTTTATPVLPQPQNIAIDASGNVWVVSNGSASNGALAELSPVGSPLLSTNFSGSNAGAMTTGNPRNLAIDPSGNAWVSSSSGSAVLYEYTTAGVQNSAKLGAASYGLVIDGSGDVFVGKESTSATNTNGGAISEFVAPVPASSNTISPTADTVTYPLDEPSSTSLLRPEYLAFDPSGNLWATDGGDQSATIIEVTNLTACSPAPCTVTTSSSANTYNSITVGGASAPYGVAGGSGGIWWANKSGNDLTYLAVSGSTAPTTAPTGSPFGTSSNFSSPKFIAVDGAGNVWAPNSGSSAGSDGVVEYSASGTMLSPTATRGYVHTGLATAEGVGIDMSGNVWIADNIASGTDGNSVFELVGAAAPTIAPLSAGLGSLIATKP